MSKIEFDGRVAIITGAGRGIGKAHAKLLAERGARVVVNDLGGTRSGDGSDPEVSEGVVEEIRKAGGQATADTSDIASVEGAAQLVRRAIEAYGRVDIVVNNAGMHMPDDFPDLETAAFRHYFDVHVAGTFNVTREAWPHMVEANYGRVVMTTSHGMLGSRSLTSYGSAKGGVLGLARALAVTGKDAGITVNCVAPVAVTRLTPNPSNAPAKPRTDGGGVLEQSSPELVSPLVAMLCHESCSVTGETFLSGGRRFARLFIAETKGYVHPESDITPEVVEEHWAQIMDDSNYELLANTVSWMKNNNALIAAVPVR